MKEMFEQSLKLVRMDEGGNDDDPQDPGGRTSRGITQREYNAWRVSKGHVVADVWGASEEEVDAIYHDQYWNPWCDFFPKALDYVFCRAAHEGRKRDGELMILLDINMPGLDGVEVLRQIKADPVSRKIPVLMLTTTDDPREVNRCYDLGCSVYITKPVDPAAFINAIKRLGLFIAVVSMPTYPTRSS